MSGMPRDLSTQLGGEGFPKSPPSAAGGHGLAAHNKQEHSVAASPSLSRVAPPSSSPQLPESSLLAVAPLRLFPPRSVLPHEPVKPERRVRWMQSKCKSGPLSKFPPGVTGKQRSSSPQHLAFVELASVSHHVVSHLDKLLLLGETFCPF